MNRIVLIGNGFDLAHGLKTSYADFINWYWAQWGIRLIRSSNRTESDKLCSFELNDEISLAGWYLVWDYYFDFKKEKPFGPWDWNEVVKHAKNWEWSYFGYTSPFFEKINKSMETKNWVDIENDYYEMLVLSVMNRNPITKLNNDLCFLKEKLIEYLKSEEEKEKKLIFEIKEKIYRPIEEREMATSSPETGQLEFLLGVNSPKTENIMLLNFNYTNTPEWYLEKDTKINYIHGRLDNPHSVIFGYGDELDDDYKALQKRNDNECLKYIKSIRYLESRNYRTLLEFVESAPFQVCIMGHSCGNSDRTLLNTLFEHTNCVSIKPYYYKKDNGEDNYLELVQNISRNFTNKKLFRDRVVNKEFCEPLTSKP